MPGGIPVEGEVLQHEHGVPSGDVGEEMRKVRTELDRDKAVAARRREHLDLQAPVPIGEIDLRPQRPRIDRLASGAEHHRKSGRTALIVLLREERDRVKLGALRNPSRTAPHQGLQLQRGAARKPEKKDARRRKAAGDTPARSRGEDHLAGRVKLKTLVKPRISVTRRMMNTRNPNHSALSNPLPAAGNESNRTASCSTSSSLMALTRAFASSALTPCRSSAARTSARSKSERRNSRPEDPPWRVAGAAGSACRRSGTARFIAHLDGPDGLDRPAQGTAICRDGFAPGVCRLRVALMGREPAVQPARDGCDADQTRNQDRNHPSCEESIDPHLSVLERARFSKLSLPPPVSRRNRWHVCNPRANISSCADSTS